MPNKSGVIIKKIEKVYKLIAKFASDVKGEDIVVLDMRKVANFCDYFVICSANNERHVNAIARNIEDELAKLGMKIYLKGGKHSSDWVVFDAGDVVTHIFKKESREFYNLEYLWQEATVVKGEWSVVSGT